MDGFSWKSLLKIQTASLAKISMGGRGGCGGRSKFREFPHIILIYSAPPSPFIFARQTKAELSTMFKEEKNGTNSTRQEDFFALFDSDLQLN